VLTDRRRFLTALAGALAAPGLALAQQAERTHRLGWLSTAASRAEAYNVAFAQRLRELGFVEGRNLIIEYRSADGRNERLRELAADLARRNCDVLLAPGTEAILVALEQASRNTPIVIVANDYDPVATGHIASFARPGGRITGMSQLQSELPAKRLELLRELLPRAKRIAVLADTSTVGQLKAAQAAAKPLGLTLHVLEFKRAPYDYEQAFAEAARARAEALLALASAHFVPARRHIPDLALKHHLPSIFGHSLWAEAGGLLSYGPNFSDFYRRAAEQVSMILKGAKPAEMPVEQASKLELVINAKTARVLGIAIPDSIRLRADRIID
jgi:putative ABC transport system substrate-binding protein